VVIEPFALGYGIARSDELYRTQVHFLLNAYIFWKVQSSQMYLYSAFRITFSEQLYINECLSSCLIVAFCRLQLGEIIEFTVYTSNHVLGEVGHTLNKRMCSNIIKSSAII